MDLHARQKLIAHQIKSGLSARAFCSQNHIAYSSFMYYRKTIQSQSQNLLSSPSAFLEIAPRKKNHPPSSSSQFTFQFAACIVLVPSSLAEKELSQLFHALRKNGLC